MDVRLSAPDLFVERSVRSAWRTAEGVGDLPMTDAADRQVLLGRWSQSRRVDAAGWGKSRIATVKRPLNHLRALQTRNFVRDDFALYGIISVKYNKSYCGRCVAFEFCGGIRRYRIEYQCCFFCRIWMRYHRLKVTSNSWESYRIEIHRGRRLSDPIFFF